MAVARLASRDWAMKIENFYSCPTEIKPSWTLSIIVLTGSSDEFAIQKWSLYRVRYGINAHTKEHHVLHVVVDHFQCQSILAHIVFVLRAIPIDNVNSTRNPSLLLFAHSCEHEIEDVFHQWTTFMGFLWALRSVWLLGKTRPDEHGIPADSGRTSMEPGSSALYSSPVTQFIDDYLTDYVWENEKFGLQTERYVEDLGDELNPLSSPILFDQIKIQLDTFFDGSLRHSLPLQAVSTAIFIRFDNPALVHPHEFGLVEESNADWYSSRRFFQTLTIIRTSPRNSACVLSMPIFCIKQISVKKRTLGCSMISVDDSKWTKWILIC